MALSLTIADNADGTGALATIAGSDVGQTATLFTQRVELGTAGSAGAWVSTASRSGNGVLALPVSPAYYWAYASGTVGGLAALSPPVYFLASFGSESLLQLIRDGVAAKLRTLSLTPITAPPDRLLPAQIFSQVWPNLQNAQLPALFVYETGSEDNPGMTTAQDDIGYPISVAIVDRRDPTEGSASDDPYRSYKKWRQQIRRALISQRLGGITQVYTCTLVPNPANVWQASNPQMNSGQAYDHYVSQQTFRYLAREPRGV